VVVQYARGLILQSDGFVVVGNRPTGCATCYADSIIVAKMDYTGKLMWQKTQPWSVPNYGPSDTYGALTSVGGYGVVTASVNHGLYILSHEGTLVKNIPFLKATPMRVISDSDGNIVLLATDNTNQMLGVAYKFTPQGDQLWRKAFDTYANQSWPTTIHEFAKRRILMIGRETEYIVGTSNHFNILLLQVDDNNGSEL
jgi:hypothetical protein